jgi:hypothetical protein
MIRVRVNEVLYRPLNRALLGAQLQLNGSIDLTVGYVVYCSAFTGLEASLRGQCR